MSGVIARAPTEAELEACLALREEVFCAEQGVPPELERDGADGAALHLVAVDREGVVLGTCRLIRGAPAWRLQRMAVARAARGRGVGAALLRAAHERARAGGATRVALSAQLPARDFYARFGYAAEGAEYEEAGMAHVRMSHDLGDAR